MFRTKKIGLVFWMALASLSLFGTTPHAAETVADLATQQEKQKQIKAETDRLVRRVETMIRLLEYNRLDKTAEKQLLDQMAGTLGGLSREQMLQLISALEKAGKADETTREGHLKEVESRHEQIVLGLKTLLARFDAIKSIDEAAERLDKMARDELDHYLQNVQMSWEDENAAKLPKNGDLRFRAEKLAGEETFLHRDLSNLLTQLEGLKKLLPPEHGERHRRMEAALRSSNLLDNLIAASRHLRGYGAPVERQRQWRMAAQIQWQACGDIQELARLLHGNRDRLAALREARQKVERAIEDQEGVKQTTLTPPEKEKPDAKSDELADMYLLWARGLSSRQASLEFDARSVQSLVMPHVKELANRFDPIEKEMREAQVAQRDLGTRRPSVDKAITPQDQALAKLKAIQAELERLLVDAEKAQADPLANLKDKLAQVEQIIKEQKDTRDKADEAGKTEQTQRLPYLEPKQEDLAKRTEDIARQPSAAKPETKKTLDKAAKAMEQATKPLKDKQAEPAVAKQEEALKNLEEAKKELAEQVAEIEKRREEIAKLEDADRKLEEMIKKEGKVADEAKKPEKTDADKLAKEQGELTPQTKELGKELEKSAPEAAKHVEDGAKQMEAAKSDLDKKQLPPAAQKADKAVEKLKEAQKAVAKALDEKKGAEAAEQAAMQSEVDPMNAAQQVAKALEQTEQAAKESEAAKEKMAGNPQEAKPNLAKLQKQVAEKAEKVDAPQAKQPAREAAEALEKGDLKKALEEQKKALGELREAAQKKGEQGEAPEGTPMPAEAKNAGELAEAQKELMEATKALAKSEAANKAAEAALAQAQAQAPSIVKPQLQKAGEKLAQAAQKLQQGEAQPANQGQMQAAEQLKQALQTLNSAMAQAGEKGEGEGEGEKPGQGESEGQGQKPGEGKGQGEGQGQGEKPGQGQQPGQGKGEKPGKSQEKNEGRGSGNRIADGQKNNAPSRLNDARGEGRFLHLPPRQRELIKQALNEKLPPEYAAMIQQYYINIARGKPASAPSKPTP
jgi:hypothetical protein